MSERHNTKTILCFGDSNTWGFIPGSDCERFALEDRWPGVMAKKLGGGYRVIEEAQNGRMTVWDDPYEPQVSKCGLDHLPVILESHKPIDLIILMLGTNDLKQHMNHSAEDIAFAVGVLVDKILESDAGPDQKPPAALVVCPAIVNAAKCPFWHLFDGAHEKSKELAPLYRAMAEEKEVSFLNAADFATCPSPDSIHIDQKGLQSLGNGIAQKVSDIL